MTRGGPRMALLLLLLVITGCSASTTTARVPGSASIASAPAAGPVTSSPTLLAALKTMPDAAETIQFTDDAAQKKRWGISDLTTASGESSTAFRTYQSRKQHAIVNPLVEVLSNTMNSWGWSGLDVDWSITAFGTGPLVGVYSLRPDLDMSVVTKSLVAHGFARSGPDTRPEFHLNPGAPANYPGFLDAVVLPDRHLLVTGNGVQRVLATIDGSTPSAASSPVVRQLLAAAPAPEALFLSLGHLACVTPSRLRTEQGSRAPTAAVQSLMPDGLHPLTGSAALISDDNHATLTLLFADASAATADAPLRAGMMRTGRSVRSAEPYSSLFTLDTTAVAGPVVTYTLTLTKGAVTLSNLEGTLDMPWAYCP